MKKVLMTVMVCLIISSTVSAFDVSIDSEGNVETGVSNTNANLEVIGSSGEDGILGSTSGIEAAGVYGVNTTNNNYGILGYDSYGVYGNSLSGWAGYFQGNVMVTDNLTVDGTITALGYVGVDWASLLSVPQNLIEISGLSCSDGQIAKYVTGAWTCVTEPDYLPISGGMVLGPLYVTGNMSLGNNFTDTIIFMGRVNSPVLPTMNITYDLGSSLNRWRNVYANVFIGDGSGLTNLNANQITTGTLLDSRLSANVDLLDADQSVTGVKNFTPSVGTVPFTIDASKTGPVANLNADLLDGQNASDIIAAASNNGVPSGFSILGESPIPPTGYSYTGSTIDKNDFGWRRRADMSLARSNLAAVAVNNRIYAIGGWPFGTLVEEYDPATDTWTTKTPMPTPRSFLALSVVNNKIYAIGGLNGSAVNQNEEYDPATDTWATKAPMPTPRYGHATAAVNGFIFAMGGNGASTTIEVYNSATDTWGTRNPMPTPRVMFAAEVVNNKIYVIGGNSASAEIEEFEPLGDNWTARASMITNRIAFDAAVVNNRIYVMGGASTPSGVSLDSNEEYDPLSDSWQMRPSLPAFSQEHAVVEMNGRIYLIGGGGGGLTLKRVEEYTPPSQHYYVHIKN